MKGSKKEERLFILAMLDEGKITVDESLRLINALGDKPDDEDYDYDFEGKFNNFSSSVDSFAKDIGSKVSVAFKDMEPKLKGATKTVVEKTVNVLNDITNSLSETLKNMEKDYNQNPEECGEDKNNTDDDKPIEN